MTSRFFVDDPLLSYFEYGFRKQIRELTSSNHQSNVTQHRTQYHADWKIHLIIKHPELETRIRESYGHFFTYITYGLPLMHRRGGRITLEFASEFVIGERIFNARYFFFVGPNHRISNVRVPINLQHHFQFLALFFTCQIFSNLHCIT